MFERFTDRARRVVVLAQEEARLLNHGYIGTEHVLLGLLHEGEGVAAKTLESLGISLDDVRHQVQAIIGVGSQPPTGHIPFTPRAKKVLELSLREALQLGHNYIGTEHLLLGLVREGEGIAAQILHRLGAELSRVREEVINVLSGYGPSASRTAGSQAGGGGETPAAQRVADQARRLAGGGPVGTHHTLRAIIDDPLSVGAKALAELGVSPEALAAKLAELATAGTTDELAEEAGARRTTVEIIGGRIAVLIEDDELRAGLVEAMGGSEVVLRNDGPAGASFPRLWTAVTRHVAEITTRLEQAARAERSQPPQPPGWEHGWSVAAYTAYNDQPAGMRSRFELAADVDEAAVRAGIVAQLTGGHPFREDVAYVTVLVNAGEEGDYVFSLQAGVREPWRPTSPDLLVAFAVLDLSQPPAASAS